jgi:hypothetical protein
MFTRNIVVVNSGQGTGYEKNQIIYFGIFMTLVARFTYYFASRKFLDEIDLEFFIF